MVSKKWDKFKRFFNLSISLARAEFILRNEGSYLGILWYLLNPILMFGLLYFIFNDRLGNNIPYYPLYLFLGLIMFNFFQNVTIESTKLIRTNTWIIKSINFPRESLIFSAVLNNFFSHLFEIILFFIFLLINKMALIGILYYFFILVFFCLFIYGACLILSSLTVYFIDLDNIWNFCSKLIWFGTPIFYAIGGQTKLFYLNLFNPIYYYITISRDIVIYSRIPELWLIIGGIFYSFLFLFLGLYLFNKLKNKFAEMI
jgi:lipopolysaccharide transport system permease protein